MSRVMLQFRDIEKHFGARVILENATAAFSQNQKIGVIGRNGAGKSTLCRILTGQEEKDGGEIIRNTALRLSYLEQHDQFEPEETALEFLTRYTQKEEWECAKVAGEFQLTNELLDQKIKGLSGGFQTRVKLAAMLLGDPNFLILDEPSNYLDLSTLILLENFLENFRGGYLIVSHDREFLKRTCDHTLEVEQGGVTLYPGNIEDYFEFKEEQLRQKMAYNKTIQKKKDQLQDFVDRFRAKASKATQAKSKMKQIQRLETIEVAHAGSEVRIKLPAVQRRAGVALFCENLGIGYPTKLVADGIDMDVPCGAHVAVLGDNGQGKTTFLKTLVGELEQKGGSYRWGTGFELAYYAQHVFATLDPRDTVLSYLVRHASDGVSHQEILDLAGSFLFKGDDVEKRVAVLSGGERARVCLAGMLLSRRHVLLLDEPTNHLDFETVEALGRALKDYEGTVFFTSHDRTFVSLVASHILDVKDGSISKYPGTYTDYVDHLKRQARGEKPRPKSQAKAETSKAKSEESKPNAPEAAKDEEPSRKKIKAEITRLKTKIKKSESRIKQWTKDRDQILQDIKKNPFHFSKDRNARLKAVSVDLEKEENDWLALTETLETLKKKVSK